MINLEEFDYPLPKEKIAQHPAKLRDHSKLMILEKQRIRHKIFHQIISEIEAGDLIVLNDSKVVAANLKGKKETGGKIESLFLKQVDPEENLWECLLKGRKLRPGVKLNFIGGLLKGTILEWIKFGQFIVKFTSNVPIRELLSEYAEIILPPYIKAPQDDLSRYQTVYASVKGSVAAPTAGFHFTPALIEKIEKRGVKFSKVTLHVGYSTFMPLNTEILSNHKMDAEYFSIPQSLVNLLHICRNENRRVIAVGTTTLKALESAVNDKGEITELNGWSDLFISPGFQFKAGVSRLITNFHMPKSSPLLMVSAFAGRERILHAYKEAISMDYRFYSFGDAMCVDRG